MVLNLPATSEMIHLQRCVLNLRPNLEELNLEVGVTEKDNEKALATSILCLASTSRSSTS